MCGSGGLPNVFAFRTFRTCGRVSREGRIHGRIPNVQNVQNVRSKIFWKKMRFTYWRPKNTALYIQRGRIIRKNTTIMYVIYVQTTLIQTDTNDTMYQRKTVKFVFWKKNLPREIPHIPPKSLKRRRINDFPILRDTTFSERDTTFCEWDTTFSRTRYHPTGHFCPKSPFFDPVSTGFSLKLYQIHFDTFWYKNIIRRIRPKRYAIFYGHILERYRFLRFRLNTVFASSRHLKLRKYVKTPQTPYNIWRYLKAVERN